MKRYAFLFLLTLSLTAQAQAQEKASGDTNGKSNPAVSAMPSTNMLWMTAGPGFSTFAGDNSNLVTSMRTGLDVQVEGEFSLTPMWSIQTGIGYLQKGENVDEATLTTSGEITANYFEIPVMVRLNLPERMNRVSFLAGIYGAIAVKRSETLNGNTTDVSSGVKSWDAGLRFGFAYEIPICEKLTSTIGVNYDWGLANINKLATDTDTIHNRSLMVAIGVGRTF
jgi:hypothetical protein